MGKARRKSLAKSNVLSRHWPQYLPWNLVKPDTTLFANLEISAQRYANRTAIGFMGENISYRQLLDASLRFAGWLQKQGICPGDRVMIFMQNSPQWIMAYYGILRADAVVVPANPMNKADELKKFIDDSGCKLVICSAELVNIAYEAAQQTTVNCIVAAEYADYLPANPIVELPKWMTERHELPAGVYAWSDTQAESYSLQPSVSKPDDLVSLNYTSGSTGVPKGCMHTHRTIMHTAVGLATWHGHPPGTAFLGVAPMYQVAGFTVAANCAIYVGGTVVPMPRWDRRIAMALIAHYKVHFASIAPTALIDILSDAALDQFDLSSLKRVSFGGATMPDSVWKQVHEKLGLSFIEAYGLTEMAATTHINPVNHPKRQCLGIPFFETESIVVDPDTLAVCGVGEPGEILIRGPQAFKGYWNRPADTDEAFVTVNGTKYFRSGDIGMIDEDGYFFMTDRAKRMINASGFKVWPAEVENILYGHPAVKEACVIGFTDPYRGESVKAVIVLKPGVEGSVSEADIIEWSKNHMAAYKYPRVVEFVESLPKSPVGKILWRELQEAEAQK